MKTMFVEARKKVSLNLEKADFSRLPEKIGLLATIQYIHLLPSVRKYLEKTGKNVYLSRGKTTGYDGQVLGCDVNAAEKIRNKVDAFLFIGSSSFHTSPILYLNKPVFAFNPENNALIKIDSKETDRLKAAKKAALMKFYSADKIGIIVSTKPGQYNLEMALEMKKKLEKKGKEAFIFVCDTIDINELENFDCGAWLNTACPSLNMEPKILNIHDINRNI